jgi:group I intron endonuclease
MKLEEISKTIYSKMSCIYKIYNNNGFYIGSTKCLKKRVSSHISPLKKKKHPNYILQQEFKNGLFIEILEILDIYEKDVLLKLENYYINTLNPPWNICKIAGAPMAGRKHSIQTRLKMKGRKIWSEGTRRTEEEKLNLSIAIKNLHKTKGPDYSKKQAEYVTNWVKLNGNAKKGKKVSQKQHENLRKTRLKKGKEFICIETEKLFRIKADAEKEYKIAQGTITDILKGKVKNVKGLSFKYTDGSTPEFKDDHYINIKGSDGSTFRKIKELSKFLQIKYMLVWKTIKEYGYFEYNGVKYVTI